MTQTQTNKQTNKYTTTTKTTTTTTSEHLNIETKAEQMQAQAQVLHYLDIRVEHHDLLGADEQVDLDARLTFALWRLLL